MVQQGGGDAKTKPCKCGKEEPTAKKRNRDMGIDCPNAISRMGLRDIEGDVCDSVTEERR